MNCSFISGGCNPTYSNFDLNGDILAYPSSNQIMVYNLRTYKIEASLCVFTKRVNCVRFLN